MSVDLIWSVIEHIGVVAFAISSAIVAIDRETDIFGVVFLSFITSFGGGIIRDLLLGLPVPLFFTKSYVSLIIVCLATSLAVFFFAMIFKNKFIHDEKLLDSVNNYIDAVGIGSFTVSGAMLTIETAENPNAFIVIFMGMTACIGGGMIRDVMLNDIPFVLRKRIYALAAAAGAGIYYVLWSLEVNNVASMIIGALTTVLIRVLATVFKWNMPKAIDFKRLRQEAQENAENNE